MNYERAIYIRSDRYYFEYSDGTKALDEVNMSIEEGKKIAVLGPNGAGKTTLFLHFNGILKPKSGKYYTKVKR